MALPVKQAADLAKSMADKGLSGSIMMKKPMSPSEEPEEAKDGEDYDMQQCIDGVAEAVASGDKAEIASSLKRLVEMIKEEDVAEDRDLEGEESSEGSY